MEIFKSVGVKNAQFFIDVTVESFIFLNVSNKYVSLFNYCSYHKLINIRFITILLDLYV